MGIFSRRSAEPVLMGGYWVGNLCHLAVENFRLPPLSVDNPDSWKAAFNSLPNLPKVIRLLLSSDLYEVITVDRPNVDAAELRAALTWSVKDLSGIPLEHQHLDFFELKVQPAGPKKLQVVVADKRKLAPLVTALQKQKVRIELITIEEIALTNLMPKDERPQLMLCQQQDNQLNLVVSVGGEFVLKRPISGVQFVEGQDDVGRQTQFDFLTLELQRSLDYLDRQLRLSAPSSINLLLPVELQQWLEPRIQTFFEIPVVQVASVDCDVLQCIAKAALAEAPEVMDEA
ncbi:MSHA biogenesis protein MshI [Ferrimonas sediminum]|uniref:MSHA biogenesis protein MshI n=1 Tax=Ferrimonas sediminum TaxID=718193 RepID=A0A1G8K7G6_9GAMM|nr:hypothetical protein [Ferrimonas sediminum]SDI39343.1 MSHA biogenesis protein MshI [Ferrimonas sediminum]